MSLTEQERRAVSVLTALQEIEGTKGFGSTPQEGFRRSLCQQVAFKILNELPENVGSFAHTIYLDVASTRSAGELWNEIQARDWANNAQGNSSEQDSEFSSN